MLRPRAGHGPEPRRAFGRARADARLAAVPAIPDHAAVRRVVDAAAKKGVAIDVTAFDESTHTASQAARAVHAELGQIVKSLVFVIPRQDDDLEPVLCLVSGPNRVDLGRLAAVLANSDVRRANAREANDLSGFVIGGIPPFGHERRMRVIMDPDLGRFETVWAAAGLPNVVFPVSPSTLRMLADAQVAPIAEDPPVERAS
jgi:prolyl-tRNA editing enzyme YbaK/EbsC (Cys-tRNA(Pro) deacylase)